MKIRHRIGKSVIVHEMEPGIDRLYVEQMREGREEEMERYLASHKAELMTPRPCMICEKQHIPGAMSKESFALGWAVGNRFEVMCIVCYNEILLRVMKAKELEENIQN